MFLSEHASKLAYKLNDTYWLVKMACIADSFIFFNEFNASSQVKKYKYIQSAK